MKITKRDAEKRANALTEALRGGGSADAYDLDDTWYVVISGTGEGYDYAYYVEDIDVDDVARPDWDYSSWCAQSMPVEDLVVAVAYYIETGRELGEGRGVRGVLSREQVQVLAIAREVTS